MKVESRTNLLFSFEKMALRDAVRTPNGARAFAEGLYDYLHGSAPLAEQIRPLVRSRGGLPRSQTRVLTWPIVTVFGFLALPDEHIFFKPNVTRRAARAYGVELPVPVPAVCRDLREPALVRRDGAPRSARPASRAT